MCMTSLAVSVPMAVLGADYETLLKSSLWSTAAAGLLMIPTAIYFIHKDEKRRNPLKNIHAALRLVDVIWMLGLGASLAYLLNFLLAVLHIFELFPSYSQDAGQIIYSNPFLAAVLCGGIVAPIAEEYVFRGIIYPRLKDYLGVKWAILLSALMFGAFHGNMTQFIYATILGAVFAWFVEYFHTLKASILLHISANVWSFVLSYYGTRWTEIAGGLPLLVVVVLQFMIVVLSVVYLRQTGKNRR